MIIALIIVLAVLLLLAGFEMFLVLGLPALAAKFGLYATLPDVVLIQKLVGGVNHSTLLAIPFFVFAAELMASGRIARQFTALLNTLVGLSRVRGGSGHATVGACMAFGSVSGSAPATVAALGGLLYPQLTQQGFKPRFSLGLIVSSAETALLIPPSITLIIYGWLTGTSITGLFAGGLIVGLVLGAAFAALVWWTSRPLPTLAVLDGTAKPSLNALWALGMPVIILGGIYSGFFTPTEAAAISALYALFVETVVYRELSPREVLRVAERSAVTSAVIFILLGVGSLLAYFVTLAQLPNAVIGFLQANAVSPLEFLLITNALLLLAGMFLDPNSALLLLVPTLYPVAVQMGIDPLHFGLIVCLNICIGMITPPFGLDLFVASSTLNVPVLEVVRGVWPFVVVNLIVLGVVTYWPGLVTFLPRLLMG